MIPKSGNKNVDTAITIAIIIGIIYALNLLLKVFKGAGDVVENPLGLGTSYGDTGATDPSQWEITDPSKLNYPLRQYDAWANAIQGALYNSVNEDEETIKSIMYQINSDADLEAIIKAYGIRSNFIGFSKMDLVTALREYTPELIDGFNYHYAGWGMKMRL